MSKKFKVRWTEIVRYDCAMEVQAESIEQAKEIARTTYETSHRVEETDAEIEYGNDGYEIREI